jgi:hypothetical protein
MKLDEQYLPPERKELGVPFLFSGFFWIGGGGGGGGGGG